MTTYQLVPYVVSVHVRGKRDELRVLSDYDNKHNSIVDAYAQILAAHRGLDMVNPKATEQRFKVDRVRQKDGCVFAVVEPGRSGIVSRLEKPSAIVPRDYGDTEFVPLRQMLVYKPGQYQALLLMEKAGLFGSKTLTQCVLQESFTRRHRRLTLAIDPAVSEAAVRQIMAEQPIKALVFHRPMPKDNTGNSLMLGEPVVDLEVRMSPPRRKFFSRGGLADSTVTSDSLLGVLAPVLHADRSAAAAVATLNEEGWESGLELKMPSGTTRTVNVTRQDAITMSFPIAVTGSLDDRPSDAEFLRACQAAVEDMATRDRAQTDTSRILGLSEGDGALCHTDGAECNTGTEWEAVWGVDNDQRQSATRSVPDPS